MEFLLPIDEHFLMSFDLKALSKEVCESHSVEQVLQIELLIQAFACFFKELLPILAPSIAIKVLEAAEKRGHQPGCVRLPIRVYEIAL